MWSNAREIAAGDAVIVWLTRESLHPLVITPGENFNSKFGNYRHSDLIGVPFGSKIGAHSGKGFVHVLRPTPELWTMALPHRTQILYLADIAFITSYLDIRRGSRVIEAGMIHALLPFCPWNLHDTPTGTGSGSFSHSVMRAIGTTGHLWSYEFHEARATKARQEFSLHGFSSIVTLQHRNVCKDGFTIVDTADSVFLDLPAPWEAVEHAKQALRKDRVTRICCFSPCMEQVLRTVSALNDAGFTEITMYETLLRPHEVIQTPCLESISEVTERLKKAEAKREDKRQRQIAINKIKTAETHGEKRKRELGEEEDTSEADTIVQKRTKTEDAGMAALNDEAAENALTSSPMPVQGKINLSRVIPEVRGHTSYLTFACLIPTSSVESEHPPIENPDSGPDSEPLAT